MILKVRTGRLIVTKIRSETLFKENFKLEECSIQVKEDMRQFESATVRLKEFGGIKGKMSQKIASIVKEHKFFSENRVCPTCNQDIEESFRLNRIGDSQNKAEELQQGYKELQQAIKEEELRESTFIQLSGDLSKTLNEIAQNNTLINEIQKQIRRLESEIQTLSSQVANKNTEHEKLEEFRESLQDTYSNLAERKESISYYDFTYSL